MLDEFDVKLLRLVQEDARLTAEQLAEKVGLAPSTVQRRLAQLRKDKVIVAEVAVVSPASVGQRLTMIVDITVERERPELLHQFKKAVISRPEVMQCYYVTGDRDFVLVVNLRDMQHFEQFVNDLCAANPNIRRMSTSVVVNPVKVGLAVPIDLE